MANGPQSLNSDAILLLEQSLLRVPVESMRKTYRTASKGADKEMSAVETNLKKVKTASLSKREEKLKAVEASLKRLEALKAKLQDCQSAQKNLVTSSRARIAHIQQLEDLPSTESRAYSTWSHVRLQRHLVDYLLRRGYTESAQTLARDEKLKGLSDVDVELFKDLQRIEEALRSGSAIEALQWCKDNASTLKKDKSTLEFDLRFQEFIELARQRQPQLAIAHCRKYLVPAAASANNGPQRIRQAMALLAFGPETTCPPYKKLYNPVRWHTLAATFRRSYLALFALPPLPLLNLSLWAGLCAIKLPSCFSADATDHNVDCPTCDASQLGSLAKAPEVPWGHHANSAIVCKVTGKMLAGEDTAYALPNGMVYSGEACEQLASRNNGRIKCPRTQDIFEWKDLKKVYIT